MESTQLQSPRFAPRNAPGRGAVVQQEVPDHRARRPDRIPLLVPAQPAQTTPRQQTAQLFGRQPNLPRRDEDLHPEAAPDRTGRRPEAAAACDRRVPGKIRNVNLSLSDVRPSRDAALHRRVQGEHHPAGQPVPAAGQIQRRLREGVQNVQGELPEAFRDHATAQVCHFVH